ncbi:PLP-dependent aminotransferase family protein [Nakamurella sp.]|uniref:MocR-like transcription factor YczR n=1 Tax=Nakamurella sp. TaxID=1869182 RepID=UPI003B3B8242
MSAPIVSAPRLTRDLAQWRDPGHRPRPAFRALAERISVLAQDGRLPVGVALPGERDLAAALQVSRTTVAAAYALLRERGYLDSRQGARSTVALPGTALGTAVGSRFGPMGEAQSGVVDLSYAAPAALPAVGEAYREAVALLPEHLAGHGLGVVGLPRLRQAVAARYTARGVPTRPEQILVTHGAQQAMTLVIGLLTAPGDRVLVEHPTYPHTIEAITAAGGRVAPVALTTEDGSAGWDLDGIRAAVRQLSPSLAYLLVDHHNPTGLALDEAGRRAIMALGRSARMTVVVDESLTELALDAPLAPPMAAFGPVISIGSASKPLWGGLRIGWIRADEATIVRLATVRAPRDLGAPPLEQLVTALLLAEIDDLAEQRRAQLRVRRAALVEALAERLPEWRWVTGSGGLSLWTQMPLPVSSRLAAVAGGSGVAVTAGPRFGINGAFEHWLRLPYVHEPERLRQAVSGLADAYATVTAGAATGLREPSVMV